MQQADRQLPGYERDINKLIDDFALQAHQQQLISFQTFRQLFQEGCYAYIHQAYWGCEHSTEYVQLLFAVALDRLDLPSPTAPQDSPLWELHHLVPIGSTSMAVMQQACSTQQQGTGQQTGQDLSADHDMGTAAAAEQMVVDDWAEQYGQEMALDLLGPAVMEMGGQQHVAAQLQPPPEPPLQAQQDMHGQQQHMFLQQQQEQGQHYQHHHQQQQQEEEDEMVLQQHHQQHEEEQPVPVQQADDEAWASSPLRLPHQLLPPQGEYDPQAAALSPVDPLLLMSPLQQHGSDPTATPGLGDLGDLLLASPAVPAGTPPPSQPQLLLQQEEPLQQAAQQAVDQHLQQHDGQQVQQAQLLQQQCHAHAAGAELAQKQYAAQQQEHQQLLGQQQQQDEQEGVLPAPQEDDDEFLSDLLAILDEAMQDEEPPRDSHGVDASSGGGPLHGPQQQQQQLVVHIPLVVKGAVIFTLLALHESQLNFPRVPVYVPLQLLKQLACAAAELRAAGGAAADAVRALQLLTSQQRLLVGQFRRPKCWEPQLPPALMPGGRLPCGLGPITAIGAAARKAARSATRSAMQSAAVAAAARAARGAAGFDPGVHREALFHIKTALRGLSNFSSLQLLCDEYAGARRAVFDPLLGAGSSSARHKQQQQQRPPTTGVVPGELQRPKQVGTGADARGDMAPGPAAMIVQRGGRRRKRKAAMATPGAGNSQAGCSKLEATAAAAAAKPLDEPQQEQPTEAVPAGNLLGGPSMDLPELFDTGFASTLQGLANSEASRMLLLLDPHYNASKVRKRTAEERRAAKAAEAAAAAAAQQKLDRFRQLTMPPAAGQAQGTRHHRQQQTSSSAAGSLLPAHGLQQELVVAGVFTEQQLEDAEVNLGSGMAPVSGGVQQVLRRAAQQRQAAVQVAQEWLRADRAMVVDDGDDDMP